MKPFNRFLAFIGGLTLVAGAIWLIAIFITGPWLSFEWVYEEYKRIPSPDGKFELVVIRGSAGATTGYEYDLYVVEAGTLVDHEKDRTQRVFSTVSRTELQDYGWNEQRVEIVIKDSPIGYYMSYYGNRDEFEVRKVGDVVLKIIKKNEPNQAAHTTPASRSATGLRVWL